MIPSLSSERRSKARFQLTVPVLIRWEDRSEQVQVGYCRNISLSGMLVFTSSCQPLGSVAELELVLPEYQERRKVRVICHGTVARVQDQSPESRLEAFAIAGPVEELSPTENWAGPVMARAKL